MINLKQSELAIEQYASCVWDPGDLIEVRCIRGNETKHDWITARALPVTAAKWAALNADGWHIYVGPAPRRATGGRKTQDCACWRTLWVDWDGLGTATVANQIEAVGLPEPTIMMETGGGVHAYWRLNAPIMDAAEWLGWQKGLTAILPDADPAVCKPPQPMRLPGFENVKYDPPVRCRVVSHDPDQRYEVGELPILFVHPPEPPAIGWTTKGGQQLEPSPATLRWCVVGSPAGTRSDRAFHVACDLIGCGFTQEEALGRMVRGATECGFPLRELEKVVASASSKPRYPGRPEANANVYAERMARLRQSTPPAEAGDAESAAEGPPRQQVRPMIVNAMEDEVPAKPTKKGEPTTHKVYRHVDLPVIRDNVKAAMDQMPMSLNGLLFAFAPPPSGLPDRNNLLFMGSVPRLYAWIQERCDLLWRTGQVVMRGGHGGSAVAKDELLESLKMWTNPDHQYRGVELLPHEPPVPGTWYPPIDLPEPTGAKLNELLAAFNPATELDRSKLLALLLTLFTGLPPGKRPAFIIASAFGRGSGKTSTAKAASRLAGGDIMMAEGEDPQIFLQRLFSDESMAVRVALIDNLKSRLDSGQLEAWITSPTIQGKRLFHGAAGRLNLLTWIITSNSPTVSSDIAQRSVIIQLGEQPIGARDFDLWVDGFFQEHRAQVIADLLAILQSEPRTQIRSRDRWSAWQDAILSRLDDGEEVARAIIDSRGAIDADAATAEDIAGAFEALVTYAGHTPRTARVTISVRDAAEMLRWEGLSDAAAPDKRVMGWLRHQMDVPPLRGRLADHPSRKHGRRLEWSGPDAEGTFQHVRLPVQSSAEWRGRRSQDLADSVAEESAESVAGIPL